MAAGQIAHRENCCSGQFGHAWQLYGSSYSEQVVMRVSVVRLCFEGAVSAAPSFPEKTRVETGLAPSQPAEQLWSRTRFWVAQRFSAAKRPNLLHGREGHGSSRATQSQ